MNFGPIYLDFTKTIGYFMGLPTANLMVCGTWAKSDEESGEEQTVVGAEFQITFVI